MTPIHITDPHLPPLDSLPQGRTNTLPEDIKNKLLEVGEVSRQHNNSPILISGDFFHYKDPNKYSPRDLNYWTSVFREAFGHTKVYGIPGNHDMPRSSVLRLPDSPYTTLVNSLESIFVDVSDNPVSIPETENCPEVVISGIPYLPIKELLQQERVDAFNNLLPNRLTQVKHSGKYTIQIGLFHTDAYPKVPPIPGIDYLTFTQLAQIFHRVDFFVLGHVHLSFNSETLTSQDGFPQIISKPWSLTRVAKEYHATTDILEHQHRPSYSLLEFIKRKDEQGNLLGYDTKASYHEISHRPPEEIFKRDDIKKVIERSNKMQDFVASLLKDTKGDGVFFTNSPDEEFNRNKAHLSREVIDMVEKYLARAMAT